METTWFIAMITVVTGLPRSGTSPAMQLLAAAGIPPFTDGQRLADTSNPQGYYEAEIVKTLPQDSAWLAQAEGQAVKVIHLLLPHLPDNREYRVLVMGRELGAVLRSQRLMLERLGQVGAALPEARLRQVYGAQLAQMEAWLAARPRLPVLRQLPVAGGTRLTLRTNYRLATRLNWYCIAWGRVLIGDFHRNVLHVIRDRSERRVLASAAPLA
jgi:hypothetical protein